MDVHIACACPAKADGTARHGEDVVTLRETLDFRSATTLRNSIRLLTADDPDAGAAEILATLSEFYLLLGVERWTFTDAKGKPIEVSKPAIREHLLGRSWQELVALTDAADELYSPIVLLPLVSRAQKPLPSSPTGESISPRKAGRPKPPTPSRQSSTSITQTAGTATTTSLRAGDSNSSANSSSAA